MVKAVDARKGMAVKINNDIHMITNVEHRTPGNLRAFIQMSTKSLNTGKNYDHRYRPSDELESVELISQNVQYSYFDKVTGSYNFMKLDTYETFPMPSELLGDEARFLSEGMEVMVRFSGETPVKVEFPPTITLKVKNTIQGVKGDTVNNVTKPATLENGYELAVPLFIKEGDSVKIDTRTGEYLGKA